MSKRRPVPLNGKEPEVSPLQALFDALSRSPEEGRKYRILSIDNFSCVACSAVNHQMVRVGSLVFCKKCFEEIWLMDGQLTSLEDQTNLYKHWMGVVKSRDENPPPRLGEPSPDGRWLCGCSPRCSMGPQVEICPECGYFRPDGKAP